ncbi:MAG: MFS transporter [Halieaceae bacterium]|jgi:predicted MFS family arabinose efflux permease|nr:MFS transporter [Halieaceae bacterium]MBT5006697.1 MFS transporter [Halieaceae bacterium]MBT6125696.1 MFS transporter [Halieaceae bacterium]MBT7720171.1 MFS transporter [Halieaceae bacterium]
MSKYYRYYVLIILTVVSMVNIMDRLIMSILLEDIKAEFAMTDTQLGLLAGLAFALFYALMSIPIARWADVSNRKNILAGALIIWSGMTALCGAATGFVSLFLARLGVGIGEAGGSPPSYSIMADYFKPSERARAMGIYFTGAVLGTGGGLIVGGLLGEWLGWRMTFFVLGVPGVLLGVLLYFTVKEPPRGRYDTGNQASKEATDLQRTLKSLARNKVYVRVSISFAMLTMVGYAMAMWLAPIMLRNFDVSLGKVGLYLGITYICGGIPGPLIGGYLTDYMVKLDSRWRAWIPAIAVVCSVSTFWFCLSAESLWEFLGFFALTYAIFMIPQGASMSLLQSSVGSGERALGTSFALLVNSMVGLALGPLLIGILSDALAPTYGVKSLNYALMTVCGIAALIATLCYLWTSKAMLAGPDLDEITDNAVEQSTSAA